MNNKVVEHAIKIDLHIHSAASKHKDGKKVCDGTIENLDALVQALEAQNVNMVSITDHDSFDFELYKALCDKSLNSKSIKKVLPGVEFTVIFTKESIVKPVHVITIFEDSDQDKIRAIEDSIPMVNGKPNYDVPNGFTEAKYWEIIRSIGLDIVTIAHQKESLTSSKIKENDANSLGKDKFEELLFFEYFEAYEYRNQKNELFNNVWRVSTLKPELRESVRFITGSDCHQWSVYPDCDESRSPEFKHTYLRCLPTFRGLAMSVTDIGRIRTADNFYDESAYALDSLDLSIQGTDYSIPLSRGFNVIIGDNSIGKSLILWSLCSYEGLSSTIKNGYEKYCEAKGLSIQTSIPAEKIFEFDAQNQIREMFVQFSQGRRSKNNKLSDHFPPDFDAKPIAEFAKGEIARYIRSLERACERNDYVSRISPFQIPNCDSLDPPTSLVFKTNLVPRRLDSLRALVSEIEELNQKIANLVDEHSELLDDRDLKHFESAGKFIKEVLDAKKKQLLHLELENKVINKIRTAISERKTELNQIVSGSQQIRSTFVADRNAAAAAIAEAVRLTMRIKDYSFSFTPLNIEAKTNPLGAYSFVTKADIDEMSPSILTSILSGLIGARSKINIPTATYESVMNAIKRYPEDTDESPTEILKERMEKVVDEKLKPKHIIVSEGEDVTQQLSDGFNAKTYFSLMADTYTDKGVYIVDQPEDQISQMAIRETVLGEFRNIARARQVIFVTHNPQFVVNLDVDNVIYLGKKDDELFIKSGALEYECDDYKMLDVVANGIEGGLDTIKRRMKRYDKAN